MRGARIVTIISGAVSLISPCLARAQLPHFDEREPNDAPASALAIADAVRASCTGPGIPFPCCAGSGSGACFGTLPENSPAAIQIVGSPAQDGSDYFRMSLRRGDILAVLLSETSDARSLTVYDAGGTKQLLRSDGDFSCQYPREGALMRMPARPFGTSLVFAAKSTGDYFLTIGPQADAYDMKLQLVRGGLESATGPVRQILFVDFDGVAGFNREIFRICDAPHPAPGIITVSPLRDYLRSFELPANPAGESALIDAIMDVMRENLDRDLRLSEENPLFDVVLQDSAHDPDPCQPNSCPPNVSRVIVGGHSAVLDAIGNVGRASSVDPGNTVTTDQAIVMLDIISGQTNPGSPDDLHSYAVDASTTQLEYVANAIGNLASHEVGHLLGSFHTAVFGNVVPSLMDVSGGGLNKLALYGVGRDGIFGTDDDVDVDFATDAHVSTLSGLQDTRYMSAIALSIPADADSDGVPTNGDGTSRRGDNPCGCPVPPCSSVSCDDNCPNRANPDQADSDGDHIGNACECGDVGTAKTGWIGNGVVDVSDIVNTNSCLFDATCRKGPAGGCCYAAPCNPPKLPPCSPQVIEPTGDCTGDGLITVKDLFCASGTCPGNGMSPVRCLAQPLVHPVCEQGAR
jgi:hypothetical protein